MCLKRLIDFIIWTVTTYMPFRYGGLNGLNYNCILTAKLTTYLPPQLKTIKIWDVKLFVKFYITIDDWSKDFS